MQFFFVPSTHCRVPCSSLFTLVLQLHKSQAGHTKDKKNHNIFFSYFFIFIFRQKCCSIIKKHYIQEHFVAGILPESTVLFSENPVL
jgi:hypothetical protein